MPYLFTSEIIPINAGIKPTAPTKCPKRGKIAFIAGIFFATSPKALVAAWSSRDFITACPFVPGFIALPSSSNWSGLIKPNDSDAWAKFLNSGKDSKFLNLPNFKTSKSGFLKILRSGYTDSGGYASLTPRWHL